MATGTNAITQDNLQKAYLGYFGRPADPAGLAFYISHSSSVSMVDALNTFSNSAEYQALYPSGSVNVAAFLNAVYQNLFNRQADAAGVAFYTNGIAAGQVTLGQVVYAIINGATGDDAAVIANKLAYANAFTAKLQSDVLANANYGSATIPEVRAAVHAVGATAASLTSAMNGLDALITDVKAGGPVDNSHQLFVLVHETAAGADSMHLTGDQDVRIDFTKSTNQITGLDLNGNGVIEQNGVENAITGKASGYEIVDAYARNPVNQTDRAANFLGDIYFDGTGYGGDGTNTNGNIVLAGLGADTVLGGIGNDFLAGGGVATQRVIDAYKAWLAAGHTEATFVPPTDYLSGGRNADFFFTELSLLDQTDGNNLFIDGGTTSDSNSAGTTQTAQDTDWLLLQASDDDEPVIVQLEDHLADENGDGNFDNDGFVSTRAGQFAMLRDIENVDASGNFYGFLNNISTTLGGAPAGSHQGIGSSAQLDIRGTIANNKLIGGYDNDVIDGGVGNDLLMGGNLNKLINPNLLTITNDGRDELIGGGGADDISFEADGGIIEGGATQNVDDDPEVDTLWLTAKSLGTVTAANAKQLITDGVIRIDLAVGKVGGINNAAGYGGADKAAATGNYTADQSNYNASYLASVGRTQVQDMENVIATGLGAIDFNATGANPAKDLTFENQQNFLNYAGDLDLRGTYANAGTGATGANILYASSGNDTIEGRTGSDTMSGGDGVDTFIFGTMNGVDGGAGAEAAYGDGVDVIWRQKDNGQNLWTGFDAVTGKVAGLASSTPLDGNGNATVQQSFQQDFGLDSSSSKTASALNLTLNVSAADTTSNPLVANDVREIDIKVAGKDMVLTTAAMPNVATMADLLAEVKTALAAAGDTSLTASLAGNTITITDAQGRTLGGSGYVVSQISNGSFQNTVTFLPSVTNTVKDILVFKAYEDRFDNEAVNDNSQNGSTISLGVDSYAQDRVVSFKDNDGTVQTRIAEDQSYVIRFLNLTTQDVVKVTVNGVEYKLTVGQDLDGNAIANEDTTAGAGAAPNQAAVQANFLVRFNAFINSFMDKNTAAGQVTSATDGANTLTFTQAVYGSSPEQTVFMSTPLVDIKGSNQSVGEPPSATVANTSQQEILLFGFDGRDGQLNAGDVKFVGNENVNRSLLATGANAGSTIVGVEANVIDGGSPDLVDTATNTTNNAPAGTTPQSIPDNTFTNAFLATNFTVHGDDLLIGGTGNDAIYGRTGDDRVIGSGGTDTVDGGGNWYAVQVQGEANARVVEMNAYEAANPAVRGPASLRGLVIISTTSIQQTQDGITLGVMVPGTVAGATQNTFADTLQFQQADFGANARFTITVGVNDFGLTSTGSGSSLNRVVNLVNGGAGTVAIDANGDGVLDAGQITRYTNFENVRTVSGTGAATAGHGQGNDTLDVSALSSSTTGVGGIRYELSDTVGAAGLIAYSQNVHASAVRPVAGDYETPLYNVDGVENVVFGSGNDYLIIDETEAAKNNSVSGGLGYDVIDYQNVYDARVALAAPTAQVVAPQVPALTAAQEAALGATERAAQPTVTIQVDAAADTDIVTMTNGRVGATGATDTPTDTLNSVEYIMLNGNTARGAREADTLDVRSVAGGAIVDYTNGQVRVQGSLAAGGTTPATPTATVPVSGIEVTIGNIVQMEKVVADGDDTVIVPSASVAWTGYGGTNTMGANATTDDFAVTANRKDLGFATFLDFDELKSVTASNVTTVTRVPFTSLTTGANDTGNWNPAVAWAASLNKMNDWMNQGQFSFDLGGKGTDTVDYSQSLDAISVRVELDATLPNQYVLVDAAAAAADRTFDDNGGSFDRVDVLTNVERIVAAQGESILDLTQSNKGLKVEFAGYTAANYQAAYDRDVYTVQVSDLSSNVPLTRTYLEYRDSQTSTVVNDNTNTPFNVTSAGTVAIPTSPTATWSRIEGSDYSERVIMNSAHSTENNVLNLRGSVLTAGDTTPTGLNWVGYNALTRSINTVLSVTDWDAANPLTTGLITATVTFQDGNGAALPGGGTHTITSYTANNGISAGALRIDASEDAEDTVGFAGGTLSGKTLLLAEQGITDNRITVKFAGAVTNSVILTGYERLADASTNDAYDMGNLNQVRLGLTLIDPNGNADHDAIIVHDDAALANFTGVAPGTISLAALSAPAVGIGGGFGLAFDVLDITKMTAATSTNLTVIGNATGTDELVVGSLSRLKAVTGFESLVLTQDTVSSNGSFGLNLDTNTVTQGTTSYTMPGVRVISAGGLALENTLGRSYVAAATGAVNIAVTDTAGLGAGLIGGDGADTLTGASGSDALYGGLGADTLYAGIATEVRQLNLGGAMSAAAGGAVTLTFNGFSGAITTVTEGAEIANGAGNDAVGAALATKINANLAAINAGAAWANGATLVSANYSADTDLLTFMFNTGVNATGAITAATAGEVFGVAGSSFTISTESVIDGGTGGNNAFRGGGGADTVYGGAGADNMIVVGSVSAADAAAYAAAYPTQAAVNAKLNAAGAGLVNVAELNTAHSSSDVSGNEVIDGGAGADELDIFGTANMTSTALTNVETVSVHSTVTFTKAQLDAMLVLNLDSGASITVSDAADLGAAVAALQSVSSVRFAAGSTFKVGFGSTAPATVDLAAQLTNDNAATADMTGAQLQNPGTIPAMAAAGIATINVPTVAGAQITTLTPAQATELAANGINVTGNVQYPPAQWSLSGAGSAAEGTTVAYTVNLSGAAANTPYSVSIGATGVNGASAADFGSVALAAGTPAGVTLVNGVLSVPAGVSSVTLNVPVSVDSVSPEAGEGVTVSLASPTGNAALAANSSVTTSITDVPPAQISVAGPAAANEGTTATYTVSVAGGPAGLAYTVGVAATGNGTATTPADFSALALGAGNAAGVTLNNGVLSIPAGVTSVTLTSAIATDAVTPEAGEGVRVALSNASNGAVVGAAGSVTTNITDVPPGPVLTQVAVSAAGASSAASGDFQFNVSMGNFVYTVSGFGAGDKIVSPTGVVGTLINDSFTDGSATVQWASGGQVAQVALTGLTNAQDGSLFGPADLNTLFGANTFA